MRKNLSVLALVLRLKMKWILITLAGMPLIMLPMYLLFFAGSKADYFGSGVEYYLFLAIFAVASFLVATECSGIFAGKTQRRYVLTRLQISERMVFVWEIV